MLSQALKLRGSSVPPVTWDLGFRICLLPQAALWISRSRPAEIALAAKSSPYGARAFFSFSRLPAHRRGARRALENGRSTLDDEAV